MLDSVALADLETDFSEISYAFAPELPALEELDEGQILQVHLNSGEPVRNVPRSVKEEGHQVLDLRENEDGTYELFIKKVGD